MEQDPSINKCIPQSLQSTNSTTRTKRPYKKIPQDLRSQILHSLTVDKLPLQEVAEKFQTKACTCKAILLTYEQEGRAEKKTSRRERVEIESNIKVVILDPLNRNQEDNIYHNVKKSKMYTEDKELSAGEEEQLQKKLIQEVNFQMGELQTSCYHLQQTKGTSEFQEEFNTNNILRGINMGLHVISQKARDLPILMKKKNQKMPIEKMEQNIQNIGYPLNINEFWNESNIQQKKNQTYNEIQQFVHATLQKSEQNPIIMDQLRYLTNQTIFQMSLKQKLDNSSQDIQKLQQTIKDQLTFYFRSL